MCEINQVNLIKIDLCLLFLLIILMAVVMNKAPIFEFFFSTNIGITVLSHHHAQYAGSVHRFIIYIACKAVLFPQLCLQSPHSALYPSDSKCLCRHKDTQIKGFCSLSSLHLHKYNALEA